MTSATARAIRLRPSSTASAASAAPVRPPPTRSSDWSTCTTGTSGNCYRTSNGATGLNSSNSVVKAVGTSTTAGCMKVVGGEGTYFADAINQAQSKLAAFKTSLGLRRRELAERHVSSGAMAMRPRAPAASPRSSPRRERTMPCGHHRGEANAAAAGTWVYTIGTARTPARRLHHGYGGPDDHGRTARCWRWPRSSASFTSDTAPPSGACPNGKKGPPASSSSSTIFSDIGSSLRSVRLVPNGTS